MTKYIKHKDGSFSDQEGNVFFFSLERFVSDICEGDCCFVCGVAPSKKEFNDEHVLPKWLLRKLDIFNLSITLPNDTKIRYSQYIVPCCKDCNSFLGKNIEEEISEIVDGGLNTVNNFILEKGPWKIFLWLSLIFLKTHLKDSYLRKHRDTRLGNDVISSDYDWGLLHHIHCMVRAIKTGVSISDECLGSLMVLPAKIASHIENYDYRDTYAANTILLRVNDIAFLAVLDDSCAAFNFFSENFKKISGPLSPVQLREVLSHLTFLNYKLKYRPSYNTKIDVASGRVFIAADLPEKLELTDYKREELGEILYANVAEWVDVMQQYDKSCTKDNVSRGCYHFLFDESGKFIFNSMDLLELDTNQTE